MNDLSLRKKLLLSFGSLLLVIAVLGGYANLSLHKVSEKTDDITEAWLPSITSSNRMIDAAAAYKAALQSHLLAGPNAKAKYEEEFKQSDMMMKDGIQRYKAANENAVYDSEEERQKDIETLRQIETSWNETFSVGADIIALSRADRIDEAKASFKKDAEPLLTRLEQDFIQPLIAYNEQGAKRLSGEVTEVYAGSKWVLGTVLAVALVFGVGVAMALTKNIMRAISELTRVSREITSGNLRESGVVHSGDELGKLTVSYNDMIAKINALIRRIQNTSEQVAASAQQLTASADQSACVTQQIAGSVADVSELSEKQVQAVNAAMSIIEHISAGIEQTAATASMAAVQTKQAVEVSKTGNETILTAVEQMRNIEETVNRSAAVVAKLGERSKEIGQIIDAIAGIAGQTNLLALNASIEAAGAGEHGKGFAVVAEEVRKLAEQSQTSAKQISDLISSIQRDTVEAVAAMNDGTQEVRAGTKVVDDAGQSFIRILETVDAVNQQASEISNTMEELAEGTQKIVGAVQDIDASGKNVAAEAQSVSAATQEQSASMEEIAASSKGLADLAQDLQTASNQFRI